MTAAAWIEGVKTLGFAAVAAQLGIGGGRMRSWGPCPACGATQRGGSDRRGPIGTSGDQGWKCWACQEHGDVLDLVAWVEVRRSTRGLDDGGWREVRAACERRGWVDAAAPGRPPVPSVGALADALVGSTQPSADARQRRLAKMLRNRRVDAVEATDARPAPPAEAAPTGGGSFAWDPGMADACAAALWEPDGAPVLDYLRAGRGFTDEAIRHWRLGALLVRDAGRVVERWVTIPLVDAGDEVVNVRFRSVPGPCPACDAAGCQRCHGGQVKKAFRVCPGRSLPLYGVAQLGNDLGAPVVIVEGELDVVALWCLGFDSNVVSGTAGAGTFASKAEWLDQLEPYRGFLLAYDDDEAGDKGADALAAKLGRYRCQRVRFPPKDVGDWLVDGRTGDDVEAQFAAARSMVGVDVLSVDAYAADLEQLIDRPEELIGRTTGSAKLDQLLGGLRPGLTVVTGDTASGKTSWSTWLCLEQARRGVATVVTSFEQRPIGTVQKLLRAQVGGDFTRCTREERAAGLQSLGRLPLWIVNHRGHIPAATLVDTIRYAGRRLDAKVALVDHLGFAVDPDIDDDRKAIEALVRALSILGEHEGITILLVAHPNNQPSMQRRRVSMSDLKGASAIRQDAHDVLVIERLTPTQNRPWPATAVHGDKIRSEFGLVGGRVTLAFDPLASVYADRWLDTPAGLRGVVPTLPKRDDREEKKKAPPGKSRKKTPTVTADNAAAAPDAGGGADGDGEGMTRSPAGSADDGGSGEE